MGLANHGEPHFIYVRGLTAMTNGSMPTKDQLYRPVLNALKSGGGSATNDELLDHIIDELDLPDRVVDQRTPAGQSRLWKRIIWARNELKHSGYVEQTGTGIWAVTALGEGTVSVDSRTIRREAVRKVGSRTESNSSITIPDTPDDDSEDMTSNRDDSWRGELAQILKSMSPSAFERLCGVILRASGFVEVNITGRSGDGGIDGKGILQLQGLISMPVSFQSKRYDGSVGSPIVREFRGSLGMQAQRGLLMTTGTFTQDAKREATSEGKVFIDLIDGDGLIDRLESLHLGVREVTRNEVDVAWWESNYSVSLSDTLDEGKE